MQRHGSEATLPKQALPNQALPPPVFDTAQIVSQMISKVVSNV